ncbi:hypothetical protein OH77DRAFT_1588712 [Trametes cingulata]|nr:hypothetical protein OH77DRAFT_1588712 [Trametes cingulata]
MPEHIRLYHLTIEEERAWVAVHGERKEQYSDALKALCQKYANKHQADPVVCERCKKLSTFSAKICYKQGIAGAWRYYCFGCGKVFVARGQTGPQHHHLCEIEDQRAYDREAKERERRERAARNAAAKQAKAREKAALRAAEQEARARERERVAAEKAAHRAAEKARQRQERDAKKAALRAEKKTAETAKRGKRAASTASTAGPLSAVQRVEAHSRIGQALKVRSKRAASARRRSPPHDEGDDGTVALVDVFANAANRMVPPPTERTTDIAIEAAAGHRTVLLVFWCKADEEPEPQKVVLRQPNQMRITDYACVQAAHDVPWFPFDYWSEQYNGWRFLASEESVVPVDDIASMVLVRLNTVRVLCGLAKNLQILEANRQAIALSQDCADDIAMQAREAIISRPKYQDRAWVVVWSQVNRSRNMARGWTDARFAQDDDFPVAQTVPLGSSGIAVLGKHSLLTAAMASRNAIEVWSVELSSWRGWNWREDYHMAPQTHTVLARMPGVRRMSLLGLEMELCVWSAISTSASRGGRYGAVAADHPVAPTGAGPPSVENVAGPSRLSRERHARSPSIEFLD